jgi:hypothetical protein
MTGPRLLRDAGEDAQAYRGELEQWLARANILRVGVRKDTLRNSPREAGFSVKTVPGGVRIKAGEFALIGAALTHAARRVGLQGLQFVVVDRSMQNGMDPSQHRLSERELGGVSYDDPVSGCHVVVLGSTPEDRMSGAWLELPDYDLARALLADDFQEFASKVRGAPPGEVLYWAHSFPPFPSEVVSPP